MAERAHYENLILGSGAGGKLLAWHLAGPRRRTAVVERRWIGGSCPNVACLPSKNQIWSAKVADLLHHGSRFGAGHDGFAVDMAMVWQRKRDMVDDLVALHLDQYKQSGAELIMGTGHFVAPKTLAVSLNDGGSRVVSGDRVFLNLGSSWAPTSPRSKGARETASACVSARRRGSAWSAGAMCSWPRDGLPTPPGSGSTWPASTSTNGASSGSMIAWRRARPMSGPSASAPAVRSSPMFQLTTFRSF